MGRGVLIGSAAIMLTLAARAEVEATPESQGISSEAILKWIDAVERDQPQHHSFVLRRHGKVVAEGWWTPYRRDQVHRLFSHSKVFTSTAAGFLCDEGRLDLDERVAAIFPEKMPPDAGERVRSLRVRDLLTMNSGGMCDRPLRDDPSGDWVKSFLADDFAASDPGRHFAYNSCATYMVAEIVRRKTGRDMMDYLEERLFRPLGITGVETTRSPSGCPCGGWGMAMKTEDLAKFGQLFLDRGRWNGREVISSHWVQLATAKHTWNNCTPGAPDPRSDWQQGYGFQWWRCQHDCYRGDGAGGQYTIVMPKEDAVLSVTALFDDYQLAMDQVWKYLLPAMGPTPLPADDAAAKRLAERCANLAVPTPVGERTPSAAVVHKLARRWTLKPNRSRYTALVLTPDAAGWKVSFEGGRFPVSFDVGHGAWRTSTVRLTDATTDPLGAFGLTGDLKLASAGAWTGAKFVAEGWFSNEAARGRLEIDLSGDAMKGRVAYHGACLSERALDFEAADGEMPVFAWTYYAFTNRLDDAKTVANWKDLGINAPLSPRVDGKTDKTAFRAFLDRCYEAGIRPYVYDLRIADRDTIARELGLKGERASNYRSLVEAVAADWGDHPAVRGFYVCDEPEAADASAAFLAARIQREVAPKLQPFLNLLPWFDWIPSRIGANTLAEYLDRARRESGLDFLGYDCYAHQIDGHSDKDVGDYFNNLRGWAEFGRRSGVRWNTTLLCVPHYRYVISSADDFRWQISTAAAMGAKGLSWFYPDLHTGPHLNYRDAPVDGFGERTKTFSWLSDEMRAFNRQFASAFMNLTWERSFCVGKTYGGLPAWVDADGANAGSDADVLAVAGENVLVSFFRDAAGTRYAAFVNLLRSSPRPMKILFSPSVGAEKRAWNGWERLVDPYDPLRTDARGPQSVWQPSAPGQLLLLRLSKAACEAPSASRLADAFRDPPAAAKPRVWWHWMNGNVTKAGITADLEAMAKAGIGGAHLFDVGCGIPPGEVKFNTPSWDDHVDWAAKEAERLGLELTLVNCSGYANAGGPWIAPSNSMFFVQYTETAVKGGTAFRGVLPRTKDDHGFYRDIAVLAFPRPKCEREPKGGLRVASPSSWVRVISADEPFALGGFTFSAEYGWGWNVTAKLRVEVSDDGRAWRESESTAIWLSNGGRSDCTDGLERYVAFTRPARARAVRVTIEPEDKSFVYKVFRPELRQGLPDLNARTFRSYDITSPCAYEVGADAAVDPARVLDLTDRLASDGTLAWDAPAGDDWVVLRVGYASNGAVVHPASSFGGGLEVNKLDAAAVDIHFDAYAGRLAKGRKAIKAVLCDSYEVGTQNWTHGLEKIFAREKGYSLVPYLIAFSGRVVGSAKQTDEVLLDYRRLISDLFVKNFVEESGRKARAAGLRYAMESYGNMSADTTHYAAKADLPMTEFWVTQDDGVASDHVGHADITKGVSSAAHLHGRDVVDAEAFTAFPLRGGRWLKDPFGLKAMGDFYYTHGVTRMVYHRFAHQPWTEPARLPGMTMGQWGTHFERTETWWPMVGPWLKYQARCQYLLSSGRPANDLLVYAGDAVPNTGTPEAVPEGWSWDVCGMHDLEDLSVVGGRLVPKDAPGVSYAALVVPTNRLITAASRTRIERLKAAGATILKSGERPSFAADFAYSGTSEKVRSICRRQDDGTLVWFVAYPSTNAATARCSFRAAGPAPQLWDAETGERFRPYDWASANGRTEVTLPFRPCGSWFVVFPAQADRSALPQLRDPSKEGTAPLAKLDGPWTLSFPKGWNCPEKLALPKLVSWTEIPDGEVRYFSGIAEYSYRGRVPARGEVTDRVFLDLGKVKNVAEVTVNGRAYPPLWRPPFRVDITDALRADGTFDLKVRVANLWPNRLIGDEQKPADCEWGYEWNTLAIKEIPAWVKAGGRSPTGRLAFTTWHHWTKDDALLPSGLLGPVCVSVRRTADVSKTFTNPIGERQAPDPFVTYDAATDRYYCLYTEGSAVRIRRAREPQRLLTDDDVKTLFVTNAALGVYRHLWAPEMHRAPNGKWYVYTSADTTPGSEWTLRLVCLESESADPFDGFHFKSFPLPGVAAIDPTVIWMADGRGYLACARHASDGSHLALYELENPWTCRGAGVELARPTLEWEKKAGSVLEGPFFVRGTGANLFLVYSANDTRSENYSLGALALKGANLLDASSWQKRKAPVLFKANGVYGPGHASFFRSRGGELWCAYHGMETPDSVDSRTWKPRMMHLQPADPDDDGCPHLAGAWGKGPHLVPDAPKERLPPLPDGAFSYVVIPDTQRYGGDGAWRRSFPNWPTCNAAFESRVNWILKHKADQNIVFVSHVGDITDCNNAPQYLFASNLMARLDGVVPWRTAAGNHDMVDKTGDTTNFERYFGSPNRVDLFETGGMKFVLLTIVCNAPEKVMRWADEQLEKYADRKAIVCTHAYLGPIDPQDRYTYARRDGKTGGYELRIPDSRLGRMPWLSSFGEYATTNGVGHSGETMWRDHLAKHGNLFLIVCGDQSAVVSQHLADRGACGNVVHAFMQDYPRDNDRGDQLRVFRFLPSEKRVEVFTVNAGEDVLCTRAKFLEEHHRFSFELQ